MEAPHKDCTKYRSCRDSFFLHVRPGSANYSLKLLYITGIFICREKQQQSTMNQTQGITNINL